MKRERKTPVKEAGKITNSKIRAVHGNRTQCFRVIHWNLGSKHWTKKLVEIEGLLNEKKPELCFITEANLWVNTPPMKGKSQGTT